ncbi:cellulose biosynthesis protein BcsS [Methylobacterium sp. P31]
MAHATEIDTLLFGSLDAGAATFLTLGAKFGFASLDSDGFVALASLGGGHREERGSESPRHRYTLGAAMLVGYQWFFDWGVVAAFAGPEGTMETLVDGYGLATLPARFGLRLHGEIWARPTDATLLQATAVAGSTRDSLWARVAWGYCLWGAYIGPEMAVYADATGYAKWNLGLHGTDFVLDRYSIRASAGIQFEAGRREASPIWP